MRTCDRSHEVKTTLTKSTESPHLLPFIGLKARLFLAPIAHPILAILIVSVRLFALTGDAHQLTADTKNGLVALCRTLDSALATAPTVAAAAAGHLVNLGLTATIDGLGASLMLAITIMEGIVVFIVRMYKSTFICFLNLAVRGSLDAVLDGVQKLNTELSSTMQSIKGDIQADIGKANGIIDSFFQGVDKVGSFLGGSQLTPPSISIPSLNALNNVTLPADFFNDLQTLNGSLPTLDDMEIQVEQLIELPFESLKSTISTVIIDLKANISVFSASPEIKNIANNDFCTTQMDLSFVDSLGADLIKAAHVIIALLLVLLLAMVIGSLFWTYWEWRCLQQHVSNTQLVWTTDPLSSSPSSVFDAAFKVDEGPRPPQHHQILEMITVSSHPRLHLWVIKVAQRLFPGNIHAQHRLRWFVGFVTHPPALLCLLIGSIGLIAIGAQLLVLWHLQTSTVSNMPGHLAMLNATITKHATDSLINTTATFANATNQQISQSEASINEEVFGWVNASTTAVNNTLNTFVDDLISALNTTLGGSVLYTPALDVMNCLLLVKIKGIQAGLDFVSSNARVTLPRLNATDIATSLVNGLGYHLISTAGSTVTSSDPINGQDNIETRINQMFSRYAQKLRNEIMLYAIFVLMWLFVVIAGLIAVCYDAVYKAKWQPAQSSQITPCFLGSLWRMSGIWERTPSTTFLEGKSKPRLRPLGLVERLKVRRGEDNLKESSNASNWNPPRLLNDAYQGSETMHDSRWRFRWPLISLSGRKGRRTTMRRHLVNHDVVRVEFEMGMGRNAGMLDT